MTAQKPLVFCALDTADLNRAVNLAKMIGPVTGGLKLGLEFFSSFGPQGVEKIRESCPEAELFLDLKFHDIPNTVAAAVKTVSENLAPAYLNVHALGSVVMMRAAKEACSKKTKLLAVTVLTSLHKGVLMIFKENRDDLSVEDQVLLMAVAAHDIGLDGIVCSGHEIEMLKMAEYEGEKAFRKNFVFMVPGIRPEGTEHGDQRRVMTPREAIEAGATHLVIGRPITGAKDPAKAAQDILDSLS